PGLMDELRAARLAERTTRPGTELLTPREAAVEAELLAVLDGDPPPGPAGDITASLAWAVERADAVVALEGPYRGLPAVGLWGRVEEASPEASRRSAGTPVEDEAHAPWR